MVSSESENLAILITDMVGYTERSVSKSRAEFQAMMERHNSVLRRTLKLYGGEWVKSTGDGMIALFRSPTNAVQCGMAMQDALAESNFQRPNEEQIQIRVSVNLGEVRREGKNDVFGEAVNVCARIEALTPPSEVYFSQAVYLAMNKAEVPSEALGMHTVKGIPEPLEIYRVPSRQATRLVASGENLESEGVPYLFGGMRHAKPGSRIQSVVSFTRRNSSAVIALVVGLAVVLYVEVNRREAASPQPEPVAVTATESAATPPVQTPKPSAVASAPAEPVATQPVEQTTAAIESSPPQSGLEAPAAENVAAEPQQPDSVPQPATETATEPAPASTAQEAEHYSLHISPQPADAEVHILNIKPAYSPGMDLAAGRYHLEVSRAGYQTEQRWITLDKDLTVPISLAEAAPPEPEPAPVETVKTPPAVVYATTNSLPGVKPYQVADAMVVGHERQVVDDRIKFYFGNAPHGKVVRSFGEFRSNKKTNAVGKSDVATCQWAFLGALKSLQARAIASGGNAVINIRSNFGNQQTGNTDTFDCKVGAMMSGVALIGVVVKLE